MKSKDCDRYYLSYNLSIVPKSKLFSYSECQNLTIRNIPEPITFKL